MQPPQTAAPAGLGAGDTARSRNNILLSRVSHSTSREHTTDSNESDEYKWNLNISADKLANIKSPMFLKLESMIATLSQFRKEYDGERVPRYEVAFLAKKAKEEERKRRE